MKWSVAGLVVAGVIAALCAAVLVEALQTGAREAVAVGPPPVTDVDVVLAAHSLPALSVIGADDVMVKTLRVDQIPERHLRSPAQVVGRVLAVPVVKGQVFDRRVFASEGSAAQLVSALPEGMRAVSVSLPDHSRLEGLLYPGSVVDVLAALRSPTAQNRRGEAISTTLLAGVEVLAIEDRTVVSSEPDDTPVASAGARRTRRVVTLMVDSRQAEALQLAAEHGAISLAMRNPLDTAPVDQEPTQLRELSGLSSIPLVSADTEASGVYSAVPTANRPLRAVPTPIAQPADDEHEWQTVIIRGGKSETKSFILSTSQTQTQAQPGER